MQLTKAADIDMQVIERPTNASRQRDYRTRQGAKGRAKDAARKRASRATSLPEFIGVDSEGIGKGANHRAVLLGVGPAQYVAKDLNRGLQWEEIFSFLYEQFEKHPRAAFVGFYLGYDFNNWLCHRAGFPIRAARSLLTKEGVAARRIKGTTKRRQWNAVKVGRWEVDLMGFKRLSIRPRPQNCTCYEQSIKCEHTQLPWMHICDAGSFYQMSFLKVIGKERWKDDPDGWPVTQEEYDLILKGKNKRATADLDEEMKFYNRLENEILARIMERLAKGFISVGIRLAKDQWYGPGASASKWLAKNGAPRRQQLRMKHDGIAALMPKRFWEICHNSYYGGWFEIFSHGIIPGLSYNYDINNAYPFASTKLPHICEHCKYRFGQGDYTGSGTHVLLYCTVFSGSDRIGPLPYRNRQGSILRPRVTKGWYWKFELDASRRAGLVKKVMMHEWAEFIPCEHPKPFSDIERLYYLRLEVGKDGAQGWAIKLNNNSIYGKFAQSVGGAPFNNWFYASYITAHCRSQILDAIATHPGGANSVLMVATDGICFDSPHPKLPVSKKLGEWDYSEYDRLVLFKPGVYWHRKGLEALLQVKSRGVPKEEFAEACEFVELQFQAFGVGTYIPEGMIEYTSIDDENFIAAMHTWPWFTVPVTFRMKSCKQALNEGNWESSGTVMEEIWIRQDSDPQAKRRKPEWNFEKERIDTIIHDLPIKELQTWYHGQTEEEKPSEIGIGFEGSAFDPVLEAAATARDVQANYDLPIEWERVWG